MAARSSPSDVRSARRGDATLRSRQDFARIGATGRTRADGLVVVRFVPNALEHDRFGISTGRRLGGAVKRNRVRRRIRAILRSSVSVDGPSLDVLVVARPASVDASFGELRSSVHRLLGSARESAMKADP